VEDILLIDDDVELCSMLTEYMGATGSEQRWCIGRYGLKAALEKPFAAGSAGRDAAGAGWVEVLRRIRASSAVSVLLLTARGEDVDRIVGLEIGADDYLSKPFNPRELLARVRAILRRSTGAQVKQEQTLLRVDGLELNRAARTVLQNGKKMS